MSIFVFFRRQSFWKNHDDGETLWWCLAEVDTEIVSGLLGLHLVEPHVLAFCGDQLTLNTGHDLHDTLISSYTEDGFKCVNTREEKLGNEFDWIWSKEDRTLQLIWRPEDDTHKKMTLIIDAGPPVTDVVGTVYYKNNFED